MDGRIFQLNSSDGGVPKLAVRETVVTPTGLACDRQEHTKIHGGAEMALCLYSLERILQLQAEGHPIYPGSVGENITLSGLVWEELAPGCKLALGEEVVVEISSYTGPCNAISDSFKDKNHRRIDQRLHPGDSRLYARVLATGKVAVGQTVKLI